MILQALPKQDWLSSNSHFADGLTFERKMSPAVPLMASLTEGSSFCKIAQKS